MLTLPRVNNHVLDVNEIKNRSSANILGRNGLNILNSHNKVLKKTISSSMERKEFINLDHLYKGDFKTITVSSSNNFKPPLKKKRGRSKALRDLSEKSTGNNRKV